MSFDIAGAVREAGVVGAGGAGFPTHVKVNAKVDTVIANGAECEPLLRGDKIFMRDRTAEVLRGLSLVAAATGARRAVLALKGHYHDIVDAVRRGAADFPEIEVFEMDNFYPAGDEQVVVHEVTGRVVPEGGIPLAVGCVVSNVVTLAQVARAVDHREPVTARPVTIVGDVRRPRTVMLPVGTAIGDAVDLAGGPTVEDPVFIDGGPMMGAALTRPDTPLSKRSGGVLVLSARHPLIRRKLTPEAQEVRIGRAVCCQCRMCTDLCPRHLLGHSLQPHLSMRSLKQSGLEPPPAANVTQAYLCSLCGLCEVYACPHGLSPRKVNEVMKNRLAAAKVQNPHRHPTPEAHPARMGRRTPLPRLLARLGLTDYAEQGWDHDPAVQPVGHVKLPLRQHVGAAAEPVVRPGDRVRRGELVGEIPAGQLGARVHASIDGIVRSVAGGMVEISQEGQA